MLGKTLMTILAILFPWMVLFIYDNPVGGVITLVLQATVIGWIPASIWALCVVYAPVKPGAQTQKEEEKEKKEDKE
ncbi:MAG: hypothetical protein NTW08_07325 [Gammaproteobacteria bacterium]|nr:hypothetical protein [Gammaproteobacteria bacterium]